MFLLFSMSFRAFNSGNNKTNFLFVFTPEKIISISKANEVESFDITKRCRNCARLFSSTQFDKHICEFSDPDTIIYDDEKINVLWENSTLRKMYAGNNAEIDKLLHLPTAIASKDIRSKLVKKYPVNQDCFECAVCSRNYVHASGLTRHMKTQHCSQKTKDLQSDSDEIESMAEVIKCLICCQIFSSIATCLLHLKSKHPEYGFDETKCTLELEESTPFKKLVVNHAFQCEFCRSIFADAMDLFQHESSHSVTVGYECISCEMASRNLKFILNHWSSECPYEKYAKSSIIDCKLLFMCTDCHKTFDSVAVLYEHRYV